MSRTELMTDQNATYEALVRMINAGRTKSQAFRKLVERLEWVNAEMVKIGALDPRRDDSPIIRNAWM